MRKPLKNLKLPDNPQGLFGAVRKHDIHTGIDFYCEHGESVHSIEDGIVLRIFQFTGAAVGSPWWNNTMAVLIKGDYLFLYGEIESMVNVGDYVKEGAKIGSVQTVLKKNKGLPMSMLHLEQYELDYRGNGEVWQLGGSKPDKLIDPTNLVQQLL